MEPTRSHALQAPVQALLQQMPLTQNPLLHSSAHVQASPFVRPFAPVPAQLGFAGPEPPHAAPRTVTASSSDQDPRVVIPLD
jgi:hypothetical protein